MDPVKTSPPPSGGAGGGKAAGEAAAGACECSCIRCAAGSMCPPMKRKLEEMGTEGRSLSSSVIAGDFIARVEFRNEAAALREALASHQLSIFELHAELEEERSASASATTEAMSMILRLQREKAEAQMEARQFKRFVEEKMTHDQEEIAALEDLIFKREQEMQSLYCEVQAYRHKLLSFGIGLNSDGTPSEPQTPDTATANAAATPQFDFPAYDYPPLRCKVPADDAASDIEKYPFGETPREQLHKLEQRIFELERSPRSGRYSTVMEKGVVGFSPRRTRLSRKFSVDSFRSGFDFVRGEEFPVTVDRASECGIRDDMSDRVYAVDAVHGAADDYVSTPREAQKRKVAANDTEEEEIRKMYARLQALEADRESMRQTIISMSTDKAQMVLLKEIAQQLCKEKELKPERKLVKRQSSVKKFSIFAVLKCVLTFIFRRRPRPTRVKYMFGASNNNVGLLLLLDKSPRFRQKRLLNRTQV